LETVKQLKIYLGCSGGKAVAARLHTTSSWRENWDSLLMVSLGVSTIAEILRRKSDKQMVHAKDTHIRIYSEKIAPWALAADTRFRHRG